MSTLVIAEHDNAELKAQTLVAVAAAQAIGGDIDILVTGSGVDGVASAASQIAGVGKVLVADNGAYEHQLAENIAAAVVAAADGYSHIVAAHTTTGKNYLPRVAALLDVAQISDIVGVVDADTFKRPIYAGNAIATVKSNDAVKVVSVRGTAYDPAPAEGGSAAVEQLDSAHDQGVSSFVGEEIAKSERPELTSAGIIISGGRGMQSGDNLAC